MERGGGEVTLGRIEGGTQVPAAAACFCMCLLTGAIYDAKYAPAMSVLTVAVYDTAVFFFFFTDLKNIILTYTKKTQIRQILEGKKLQIARFFIFSSSMLPRI
jgi:hypothetical protein